jgi:hypothetical protein
MRSIVQIRTTWSHRRGVDLVITCVSATGIQQKIGLTIPTKNDRVADKQFGNTGDLQRMMHSTG